MLARMGTHIHMLGVTARQRNRQGTNDAGRQLCQDHDVVVACPRRFELSVNLLPRKQCPMTYRDGPEGIPWTSTQTVEPSTRAA